MVRALDRLSPVAALLACACVATGLGCAETDAVQADEQPIIEGSPATAYPEAVHVNGMSADKPTASCSGVLISPRAVLTAAHCVDGYRGWGVLAPFADDQWAMSYDAVVYDWTTGLTFSYDQHDVAIVFLPKDILIDEYPEVSPDPVADNTEVVAIGRVNNGYISDEALFVSKPFPIFQQLSISNQSHPYAYGALYRTIQKGDSGGPVMLLDSEPRALVAVNSTYHFFARLDLLHEWIAEQLQAHSEPSPN